MDRTLEGVEDKRLAFNRNFEGTFVIVTASGTDRHVRIRLIIGRDSRHVGPGTSLRTFASQRRECQTTCESIPTSESLIPRD